MLQTKARSSPKVLTVSPSLPFIPPHPLFSSYIIVLDTHGASLGLVAFTYHRDHPDWGWVLALHRAERNLHTHAMNCGATGMTCWIPVNSLVQVDKKSLSPDTQRTGTSPRGIKREDSAVTDHLREGKPEPQAVSQSLLPPLL